MRIFLIDPHPMMRELRHAVGLRGLLAKVTPVIKSKSAKANLAAFKQYREADGQFYFKLLGPDGNLLLQSLGFESPKEAALAIAGLKQQGVIALKTMHVNLKMVEDHNLEQVAQALQTLMDTNF